MSEEASDQLEHAEHARHAHASGESQGFVGTVSLTIALLAVLAATVGSLETLETGAAISAKNDAVLVQNRATDSWSFFQAKSTKKELFQIAALTTADKALAGEFARRSQKYAEEQADVQKDASRLEREASDKLKESDLHEARHHKLTVAVTLLHVSIAVATISIIAGGRRWPWLASILLGVVGLAGVAVAYV